MFGEIFKFLVIALLLLGSQRFMKESKALKVYRFHLRDSVYQELAMPGMLVDPDHHKQIVDSLYSIQLNKLGY